MVGSHEAKAVLMSPDPTYNGSLAQDLVVDKTSKIIPVMSSIIVPCSNPIEMTGVGSISACWVLLAARLFSQVHCTCCAVRRRIELRIR